MGDRTCVRCGGWIDATLCKFCGAEQPLPNGCVRLTPEGVVALLRERLAGVDSTAVHPAIPPKKLAGVRKSHPYLPPDEVVLAIYDGTVFGSATDGFYVTATRIGWKNQMEGAHCLEWSSVDPDAIWVEGTDIVVGNAKLGTLYGKEGEALYQWCDAITSVALSAHPAKAFQTPAAEVPLGPTAWDGVASSWPPPPPSYHANDLVERLPRRPYESFSGCSVVDAQAQGNLVVACGGETVEIRYAANGARFRAFQAPDIVLAVKFSPDGHLLALGTLDHALTVYEVESGRIVGQSPKMSDGCDEILWLDATRLAIGSQRGELWIVGVPSLQPLHRILGPSTEYETLGGLACTLDGRVVFASVGSRLGAFDTTTGKILWRFDGALTNASRLAVSPRGDVLVAAGYDGVALFDARTGQPGARMPLGHARGVSWPEPAGFMKTEPLELSWSPRPRFSPSGDLVALQDPLGNLVFLDTSTYALHPTPRDHGRAWIEDIAWFADGNHLVVGGSDNSLAIWRVRPLTRVLHTSAMS